MGDVPDIGDFGTVISDAQWLGLLLRSESDLPHEWWNLAWAVRNRVASRRYPDTYARVICQPWQFSYFNPYTTPKGQKLTAEQIYLAAKRGYAGDSTGWSPNDLARAEECALAVMEAPHWQAPFSPYVQHFWSPVSMRPRGRTPSWAKQMRIFSMPGVDPDRWLFAESTSR